jgi:hypothetical protein
MVGCRRCNDRLSQSHIWFGQTAPLRVTFRVKEHQPSVCQVPIRGMIDLAGKPSQSVTSARVASEQEATVAYIGDVCHELRKLALDADLDFVAYLLEMANLECLRVGERR